MDWPTGLTRFLTRNRNRFLISVSVWPRFRGVLGIRCSMSKGRAYNVTSYVKEG